MIKSLEIESDLMKIGEYNSILKRLNKQSDIQKLAGKTEYSKDLLLVLYSQKIVTNATKKYHKIKYLAPKYHTQWENGKTFLEIAEMIEFPPVLTGLLILKEEGVSRKMYRKYLNDLDLVEDERLKKELKEVIDNDIVYSPDGNDIQAERGREGEKKIHEWLTEHNFKFQTEKELSDKYDKTPDFLLKKPINVRGTNIHWIESKATFGSKSEIKKNLKNQLIPYRERYSSGMVIYWFDFLTPIPIIEGILIETGKFFEDWNE
jgi:hypothetical protein